MKRAWLIWLLFLPLLVTGCNLLSPSPNVLRQDPDADLRDLRGTWSLILHIEAMENELLPVRLFIRDMDCAAGACKLSGYLEVEVSRRMQRYALIGSVYYPGLELVRLSYHYATIGGERREAVIVFDFFLTGDVPLGAMAGHVIVYDLHSRPVALTPEDESILQVVKKGKTAHAGQVTAWKVGE